jgi:hypothetical protein
MYQSGFGYPSVVRPAYQPYAPSYGHPLAASYNPYASFASPAVIPRPLCILPSNLFIQKITHLQPL